MNKFKIFILLCLLLIVPSVDAASASISVSTSSTTVGGSGTAVLTVSGDGKHIGQIYGTFTCGGLGNVDLTYVESNNPATSKSYTISWKGNTAGTYTCNVSGLQVGILEQPESGLMSVSASAKTITVKSATSGNSSSGSSGGSSSGGSSSSNYSGNSSGGSSSNKKIYSSDNTLSSLSIEGYDLEPKFSKDTTEYKLEVDESVEKVKVKASANDEEAEVKGAGEVSLSSGENTIEIKVIAENGNEKVYKIIINVVDKNPIEVTVDKKKYTVVKKNNDLLDKLEKFEETSIKINNQDVTAYTNKNSKLTLVILKDDKGEYNYFVFNSKKNSYELYREIKYNGITLFYNNMDNKLLPKGYKKYSFKYGELKLDGYKYNKKSDFYIFYAMNIDNGNLSLYTYDEKEKTIQRYNSDENNYLTASLSSILGKYKIVSYVSTGIVCTMLVIGVIMLIKKRKMM